MILISLAAVKPCHAHGPMRWYWIENWRMIHVYYGSDYGWAGPLNPWALHSNYVIYDCPWGWWNFGVCKRTKINIHASELRGCLYLYESEHDKTSMLCLPRGTPGQVWDDIRTACGNFARTLQWCGVPLIVGYLLFCLLAGVCGGGLVLA